MLKSFKGFKACLPGTSDDTSEVTQIANSFDAQQVARSLLEPLLSQLDTLLCWLAF